MNQGSYQQPLIKNQSSQNNITDHNASSKNIDSNKASLYSSVDLSPIERYNVFIQAYNNPINQVNSIQLKPLIQSKTYNSLFKLFKTTKGKIISFIILLTPIVNIIILPLVIYCFCLYWDALSIHKQNISMGIDPFKNMIFDPDLCYTLKRNFYFFNIQFKDLQGFTLNYNQQMKKQLHTRRGKASFMIYNASFWAHFHHFVKWKNAHILMLCISVLIVLGSNIGFVLLLIVLING